MAITNARRLSIIAEARKKNLPSETITQLEAQLDDASPTAAMFQDMFYAQSEATRLMQDAKQAQRLADEAKANAEKQTKDLTVWKFQAEQAVQQADARAATVARKALDKIESLKAKASTEAGASLEDFTLDPTLISLAAQATGTGTMVTPPTQATQSIQSTTPPIQSTPQGATPPMPNNNSNNDSPGDVNFAARMFNIPTQHFQLFGTMPDMEMIITEANRRQIDPHDVWKETYNIDAKRAELEQAKIDKVVNERVEAAVQAKLQELAPNLQSSSIGDFSKVMESFRSPALRHVGPGNNAMDLDEQFRGRHSQGTNNPPPNNPSPDPVAPGTLAQRQSPRTQANEEAEWAKDFGDRLANIA